MASIFDSLKGLITPELISKAASTLGEDNSGVTKAITTAVPSILGSLLAKGDDPKVESVLKQAGDAHGGILSNITNIFSGASDEQTQGLGSSILNSILGNKLGGLSSIISSVSGISGDSSNKILSMVGPFIGGFLGNKMSSEGLNLSGLLGKLNSEKGSFLSMIPEGLTSVLGISSLASLGSNLTSKAKDVAHDVTDAAESVVEETKGGLSWVKWLIPLLLLLGVIIFAWKSCKDKVEDTATSAIEATSTAAGNVANSAKSLVDLSLPDGTKLQGFDGGIESQMINFLQGDEYKNATPEALKNKWFSFDNINFKFGSGTELTEESHKQVDNVVAILKHYKDAKIKIGAYTDKKGDSATNLKISQERANTIQKIFAEKGIGSQISGAEGYGDKFATVAADASDEERASDRKIAIRFDK